MHLNGYIPEPVSTKHWDYNLVKGYGTGTPTGDVDLRPFTSPRHDQRWTNSCVAQSVVKALEIKRIMRLGREAHVDLSVLAVYYLARELMFPQMTNSDHGTHVSQACDVLRRFGVPTEKDWPYDLNKVNLSPSWGAMRKAYLHKIDAFYRITSTGEQRVEDVRQAIREGHPVIFGSLIGSNWKGYKGQVLHVTPDDDEIGRHATVLLGVQGDNFIGENSWGAHWGEDGFYTAAPDLVGSVKADDFWVIKGGYG